MATKGFKQPHWMTKDPPTVWKPTNTGPEILIRCDDIEDAHFECLKANLEWQFAEYGETDPALEKEFVGLWAGVFNDLRDDGLIMATGETRDGWPVFVVTPSPSEIN